MSKCFEAFRVKHDFEWVHIFGHMNIKIDIYRISVEQFATYSVYPQNMIEIKLHMLEYSCLPAENSILLTKVTFPNHNGIYGVDELCQHLQ